MGVCIFVCISDIDTCCDVSSYSYGFLIYEHSVIFSYKVYVWLFLPLNLLMNDLIKV